MEKVDLHLHTHYSDGKASPQDLLEQAQKLGLKAIAISDHETTMGNKEGQKLAADYAVELVPAIEVTCYWGGYTGHGLGPDIDLLGYFVDLDSDALKKLETEQQENIRERAEKACIDLQKQGYKINIEAVLETNPNFPGFMPMYYTLKKEGVSDDKARTLLEASWHRSGPLKKSIFEAIDAIHAAGGVVALAHPSIILRETDGSLLAERGLMALKQNGLDAIEVFHYRLDRQQRRHFRNLAKRLDFAITGGSDEHGGVGNFARFGSEDVTLDMLEQIRSLSQKYKS